MTPEESDAYLAACEDIGRAVRKVPVDGGLEQGRWYTVTAKFKLVGDETNLTGLAIVPVEE